MQIIGFDMGGTSTDVSRYDGSMEHVLESTTAGVTIQAPQLDINTVAAGGGSRLFYDNDIFAVGPESAGAHPGPVCYRKPGGKLAVTDANAALGRIVPDFFPKIFGPNEDEALDVAGVQSVPSAAHFPARFLLWPMICSMVCAQIIAGAVYSRLYGQTCCVGDALVGGG